MSQVSQPSSAGLVALSDQLHVVPKQHFVIPAHGKDAGTEHQTNCNSQRRGQDIVIYLYLSLSLIRNDIHPTMWRCRLFLPVLVSSDKFARDVISVFSIYIIFIAIGRFVLTYFISLIFYFRYVEYNIPFCNKKIENESMKSPSC